MRPAVNRRPLRGRGSIPLNPANSALISLMVESFLGKERVEVRFLLRAPDMGLWANWKLGTPYGLRNHAFASSNLASPTNSNLGT